MDGWEIVAENVGVGYDVDSIHTAFMRSATHRSNILNADVTELGVGVVVTPDARIWVVEIFRRPMAAQQASAPPAAAPQPPAPALPKPAAPARRAPEPAPVVAPPPVPVTTPAPLPSPAGVELAFVEVPRQAAQSSVAAAAAVVLPVDLPRPVPTVAGVAAFLLAASVALQGVTLRRLGLVG